MIIWAFLLIILKLRKLKLTNFRNYSNLNIKFDNNMNIFIGSNAQGKTNLLESIVFLSLTKSHRVGQNPNIIMFNKNICKINGVVKKGSIVTKLECRISDKKELFKNGTNIRKVSDYISNLNVIVFGPDDLDIVKGSPSIRRNLLNIELSQIDKDYLNTYNEFNKILRIRNEYLKMMFNNSLSDKSYLDILTDKFIDKAILIYQKRYEFINKINKNINDNYNFIGKDGNISIYYDTNIEFNNFSYDEIKNKMNDIIKSNYYKELKYGMSLYGPHRDDFIFNNNDKDIKYYGSQGQQKLAILSFKLSEIDIFNNITGEDPILLLDDIFSEFDIKKRNNILKYINSKDIQCFITTTDLKNINKRYISNASIYEVKEGNIGRK